MLSQNNIFIMENNKNASEDCSSFIKRKLVKCCVIKQIVFGTSCFMKIKKVPNESFSHHLIHNLVWYCEDVCLLFPHHYKTLKILNHFFIFLSFFLYIFLSKLAVQNKNKSKIKTLYNPNVIFGSAYIAYLIPVACPPGRAAWLCPRHWQQAPGPRTQSWALRWWPPPPAPSPRTQAGHSCSHTAESHWSYMGCLYMKRRVSKLRQELKKSQCLSVCLSNESSSHTSASHWSCISCLNMMKS